MKRFTFLILLAALGAATRVRRHRGPSRSHDGLPRESRSPASVGTEVATTDGGLASESSRSNDGTPRENRSHAGGDAEVATNDSGLAAEHVQQRAHAFEEEDEQMLAAAEDLVKSTDVQQVAHIFRRNLEEENETFWLDLKEEEEQKPFYDCEDPWSDTLENMWGEKGDVLIGMTFAVVRNLKFFLKVVMMFEEWKPLVALMPLVEDFLVRADGIMRTNSGRSYIIPNIPYYKFVGEVLGVKERPQATASTSKDVRKQAYKAIVTALHNIMDRPPGPLVLNYQVLDAFAVQLQKLLQVEVFGKKVALYIFETLLYYALFATEEIADRLEPEKVAGRIVREHMASDPSLSVFLSMAKRFLGPIQ